MFDLTRVASRKVTQVTTRKTLRYYEDFRSFLFISSDAFTFVSMLGVLIFCPTDTETCAERLLVKESCFHLKARFFIFTRDFHFGTFTGRKSSKGILECSLRSALLRWTCSKKHVSDVVVRERRAWWTAYIGRQERSRL